MRVVGLLSLAVKNKRYFILSRAHIFGIEISVLIKHLGVSEAYLIPRLAACSYFRPARHILTKVNNCLALWSTNKAYGFYALDYFYG